MADSRCGLHCSTCTYREPWHCGGCIETNGRPFHGDCPVAACCQSRGLVHCGQCPQIPCELLTSFSNDPEYGDDTPGDRIAVCMRWREEEPTAK